MYKLLQCYICFIFINIIFYLCIYNNIPSNYISNNNSLCYSWIPSNKYEIKNTLCNINCSYTRFKLYPYNSPLSCAEKYMPFNKNKIIHKIYLFNTTTYGKYAKSYRYYYGLSNV